MRIHCSEELHPHGGPGRFLLSRAEDALPALLADYRGRVQLIYLDPPFGTGDVFHLKLPRGGKRLSIPIFSDTRPEAEYLGWMRTILEGCRELLSPTGALYLHIDYRMSAQLRLLLDEIFGRQHFMNEIIWSYKTGGRSTRRYPRKHDNILFYRKSSRVYFNISAVGKPRGAERRNHMKRFVDADGRVCFSIRSGGKTYTYYEDTPVYPSDVWTDIEHLQQKDRERVGYATQKPEALLERIVLASSREGDLVMDLFSGSGTTAAVASRLGRRFVAVDASPAALYTLRQRQLRARSTKPLPLSGAATGASSEDALLLCHGPAAADESAVSLSCTLLREKRGLCVSVDAAGFDSGQPVVYLALGKAEGGRFLPCIADWMPNLPKRYALPFDMPPVLQVVDALGRQAFFALEEPEP